MTSSGDAPDRPAAGGPVGFVGLGHMGEPMAIRMARSGLDLLVWSRNAAKVDQVVSCGATAASSVDEVFARSRVVLLMLASGQVIDEVLRRDRAGFGVEVRGRTRRQRRHGGTGVRRGAPRRRRAGRRPVRRGTGLRVSGPGPGGPPGRDARR